MERLIQRSPEELLSETLDDLMESYRGLKQNLNEYSQSVRNLNTTIAGTAPSVGEKQKQKFPDSLQSLKDQSVEHFKGISNSYQDYASLMETFQTFFDTYRGDFEYWITKESRLQRNSEDFKPAGDKIVEKMEKDIKRFKKSVEEATKALSEAQDTLSIHQEHMEKSSQQQNQQNLSCCCIMMWIPRKVRKGYCSIARKCRKPNNRNKSSSYENLVLQKENSGTSKISTSTGSPSQMQTTTNINETEKILNKMSAVVAVSTILISSMYTVSNGMSYIHQELCRLDYLDANKENHFEIVSKNSETLIKVISLVYSGLTIAQSESLKLVKTGFEEDEQDDSNENDGEGI